MFQEFVISRLEDEAARERRDMEYHRSEMVEYERSGYDAGSDHHYNCMVEHSDRLADIEQELTIRYRKVREIIETEHLADLSLSVIAVKLDEAWGNMTTIQNEFPRGENYYTRYNEQDVRSTALMMLLIQKRIASVSPNTESRP